MKISEWERKEINRNYPDLLYHECDDYCSLTGNVMLNHTYNNICMTEQFLINIIIPVNFPYELPKVTELNSRIDKNYPHLYQNGEFCLASNIELKKYLCNNDNICEFIDNYVIPYLYTYKFYEEYGIYPFGERSHGFWGDLEYLGEICGTDNINKLYNIMFYIGHHRYRGHNLCPCGSNKKIRNCHGDTIKMLINSGLRSHIILILEKVEEVLKNAKQYHRSNKKIQGRCDF